MAHSDTAVRPAAVAGAFYPGNAVQLAQQVDTLLAHAHDPHVRPKALIVPHAGYIYSGPVAASAYAAVAAMKPKPTKVVLLGPSHHVGFNGLALTPENKADLHALGFTGGYPATGSLTAFTFRTDSSRELPEVHYFRP